MKDSRIKFGEVLDGGHLVTIARPWLSFHVRFDQRSGTLLLDLGGGEIISPLYLSTIEHLGFVPKSEIHVTVLGFRQGKILASLMRRHPKLIADVEQLVASTEWRVLPIGERYILTKQNNEEPEKQSIIEMIQFSGVTEFITELCKLTGADFYEQVPHVTLATKGDPMGIGIYTLVDLDEFGTRIK